MRNIAKKFKMTMSLIDIETVKPRYKCFFGEDVELCISVVDEDSKPLDLTDVNAKVYYTSDKFEPLRQDNAITINEPASKGTINILVNKKYLRLGVNTIRVALFDSDQEVLLQPCQINCIETGIGDEHGDVIVNDDISVKDEFIRTNNKINGINGRLTVVEGDIPEIESELVDVRGKIVNTNNKVNGVDNRLKVVEGNIPEIKSDLEDINEQLEHKVEYTTESKVHFIKTKSSGGDCILIESAKNILIDTGNVSNPLTLINYLQGYGINNIDYLIITHYHPDHVGGANAEGLIALCNSNISIGKIVLPHQKIKYSSFIQSDSYKVGAIISAINNKVLACCNDLSIPMHYPVDEEIIQLNKDSYIKFLNLKESNFNKYYNHTVNAFLTEENATNYNNFSMVVEYHTGNNDFLFASDIEELAQESIYSQLNKADVLKMEHHSLNYNCNEKYFDKIQPKIAVVMPLHPNEELGFMKNQHFNELINNGVPIFSTENGSVVIKSDYTGVNVISDAPSINKLETYNLAQGIALQDGTDLDDCREVGIYNSVGAARTNTMINVPFKGAGFKLIVEKTGIYNCLKQTCIINNTQTSISYTRQTHEQVWGDWRRISPFNEIATPISNIDLNNLKTPGEYYSENTANTTTITNAPVKSGFRIEVKQITAGTILQKVIANSDNIQEFYRYFTNIAWQPWYTFTSSKYLKSEISETIYGVSKNIEASSNLDSYKTPGGYTCIDRNTSATITNKPAEVISGFRLEVKATNSNIRYQILYANDDNISIYARYYDPETSFSAWKKLKFE